MKMLALFNHSFSLCHFDWISVGQKTDKAKFHYAILVADRSEAGRRPVADLLACG